MLVDVSQAKREAVGDYVREQLQDSFNYEVKNIAVFLRHNNMKEHLIATLRSNGYQFRDFTTSKNWDEGSLERFNNSNVPVCAILSLSNLSTSLDLRSVRLAIFAEFTFEPNSHALGERLVLNENPQVKEVHYLMGQDSEVEKLVLSNIQRKRWSH